MNTYIISYEFDTKEHRDAWVALSEWRHAYKKDGLFVGIDWQRQLSDEAFIAEADTIGNNTDEHGRTGRRDVVRYIDENETLDNVINRAMIETAIQYGVFITTE